MKVILCVYALIALMFCVGFEQSIKDEDTQEILRKELQEIDYSAKWLNFDSPIIHLVLFIGSLCWPILIIQSLIKHINK